MRKVVKTVKFIGRLRGKTHKTTKITSFHDNAFLAFELFLFIYILKLSAAKNSILFSTVSFLSCYGKVVVTHFVDNTVLCIKIDLYNFEINYHDKI